MEVFTNEYGDKVLMLSQMQSCDLASLLEFFGLTYHGSDKVTHDEVRLAIDIAEALNG